MKRFVGIFAFVAGPVLYSGYTETGVAVTVGYTTGAAIYLSDIGASFAAEPVFWGAYLVTPLTLGRWNPGALLVDTGFLYWSRGRLLVGHVDLALSADIWIFRTSLAAGVNFVKWSEPGFADFRTWVPDVRVRFHLKIGAVSAGISASVPIDLLWRFVTRDWPVLHSDQDELRIFAAQTTVSVAYWFSD